MTRAAPDSASPWLSAADAAVYLRRGRRFILKECRAGRLRHAVVGGRQEVLLRAEWLDQYVTDQATPILMPVRRRA